MDQKNLKFVSCQFSCLKFMSCLCTMQCGLMKRANKLLLLNHSKSSYNRLLAVPQILVVSLEELDLSMRHDGRHTFLQSVHDAPHLLVHPHPPLPRESSVQVKHLKKQIQSNHYRPYANTYIYICSYTSVYPNISKHTCKIMEEYLDTFYIIWCPLILSICLGGPVSSFFLLQQ